MEIQYIYSPGLEPTIISEVAHIPYNIIASKNSINTDTRETNSKQGTMYSKAIKFQRL
jgi:hypothetical protein